MHLDSSLLAWLPSRCSSFAGLVSRVFDVWNEGTEQQCYRDRSISMYNWYCEQDKFLISTPTWPGASGSPVISATVRHWRATSLERSSHFESPFSTQNPGLTWHIVLRILGSNRNCRVYWPSHWNSHRCKHTRPHHSASGFFRLTGLHLPRPSLW